MNSYLFSIGLTIVMGAVPLIFGSLAALMSERAGVIQIAIEGLMLIGALCGAIGALYFHSSWMGLVTAMAGSIALVSVFAFFVLKMRINQVVAGAALNILAFGVAPLTTKYFFDSTGSTPSLDLQSRFSYELLLVCVLVSSGVYYLLYHTSLGLKIRFAGEEPLVLTTQGFSELKTKLVALIFCGALSGLGGASLSLLLASQYSPMMTAGRGFMALACLIYGRWKPVPTILACFLFSFFEVLQIKLQSLNTFIPAPVVLILPYLLTIVIVSGFLGKSGAPQNLGRSLGQDH